MNKDMSQTEICHRYNIEKCMDAEDFISYIFPYCRSTSQRWKEEFITLLDEDIDTENKTIKKGIITDIFNISDLEKRREIVIHEFGNDEYEDGKRIYDNYFAKVESAREFVVNRNEKLAALSGGSFTRNTLKNWKNGCGKPRNRDVVIKLAFWSRLTIEETNKLLDCAGMPELYIKGKNSTQCTKNSISDLVYIHMLNHGMYSFEDAKNLIEIINKEAKTILSENLRNPQYDNTKSLEEVFYKKKIENLEGLKEFFYKNVIDLVCSYKTFCGLLVKKFGDKYMIKKRCKGNWEREKDSIREFTESKVRKEYSWREGLRRVLYMAYKIETEKKHQENNFLRKHIIVLGLILNENRIGINNLLKLCKEPPLYDRDYTECIVINATDEQDGEVKSKRTCPIWYMVKNLEDVQMMKYYDPHCEKIEHFREKLKAGLLKYEKIYYKYKENGEDIHLKNAYDSHVCVITALKALQTYEWIKNIYKKVEKRIPDKEKEKENDRLIDWFPEKRLFEYLVEHVMEKAREEK